MGGTNKAQARGRHNVVRESLAARGGFWCGLTFTDSAAANREAILLYCSGMQCRISNI
jgi:hypothetical protein